MSDKQMSSTIRTIPPMSLRSLFTEDSRPHDRQPEPTGLAFPRRFPLTVGKRLLRVDHMRNGRLLLLDLLGLSLVRGS
jgi:hypothetical protein